MYWFSNKLQNCKWQNVRSIAIYETKNVVFQFQKSNQDKGSEDENVVSRNLSWPLIKLERVPENYRYYNLILL